MTEHIELSIIIPVYNTELYLEECLNSILEQGLDDYEILIINDGSTDRSKIIAYEYCQLHPNIQYFEQENLGQGAARNVGIRHSKGKYIYFMDSDDYLASKKLKKMLSILQDERLDAVFFDGKAFLHENKEKVLDKFDYERKKEYGLFNSGEELLSSFSRNNDVIIQPCLYIVKADVIKNNNLYFPDKIKHEDEFFTVTLFLYLENCMHIKENVFMRRVRENSTMTNKNKIPSFVGYSNVLNYFDEIYTLHTFRTRRGQQAYYKKISQLAKSALKTYQLVVEKSIVEDDFANLKIILKKYKFFNMNTFVYYLISKNKFFLSLYTLITKKLKN